MSAEIEIMQQNTQRLTNVVDNYLNIVKESLSGMTEKIGRIAENISGDPLPTEPQAADACDSSSIISTMKEWKLDKLYDLISNLSNIICISSHTSADISSEISSNYETILSVCYDTIDNFYAENNISNFITFNEISAEVFEYEQANGEIDVDLSSGARGINIANTIRDGFIQGQSDMGMIEYRATKLIPSDVLKIKSGIERDSPDISEFLAADDCEPTNRYISHCDQFFDLYNSIIDRLINDAQDENKIIELFGYVAGLNNTNGDLTNTIKNYVKYFKIHENDIDIVLNDIKSTTSINTNRVILKDVIPENTRDASTATKSAAEIAESLREYTAGQWNKPLLYTNYGAIARTSDEIRDIINSYENAKASSLTNFQLQNVRSCKAALEALRLQTKYLVQGSAYASKQALYKAFLDCKNLINVVEPLTRATIQSVGPRMKDIGMILFAALMTGIKALWAFLLSPTGLVVIGIIIVLLLLYLIFRDRRGFNRPIDLSKDLVKNILNATKKLNGYATSVSDPFVDNVKKDLGHHTQYVEITVDDGYNSITKDINIEFLSEELSDLQVEVDNLIKADYKITDATIDHYKGTFYGAYIEMFECIGNSITDVVDQCMDLLLPNEKTITIDAYPAVDLEISEHEILWKGGEWACGIHCYVDKSADITYEEVSNGGWEGYAYYIDDNGNEVIVDHALGTSETDKNSTEGWTQEQVDEYYSCKLPEAESISINILGQTKTVTNIKWKIGDKLYNPGDLVRVPIVYVSNGVPGIGKENLIHGENGSWCTAIAELQGDIA